ncbi:13297_t:CDS:2 [Acaulospora morrowiae]|uniref:Nucleolar protein 58 n=1 Tax=Acaulospora morrowiae TaxID=94023 RepID=A0A9N8ZCM9_9GLOM|nr:13297_t:CDS:2 [Acaulospora morrowiae]
MLVLFETAAGYALFQVLDEGKLENPEDLWKVFETPEKAKEVVKLKSFKKFESMSSAVSSVSDLIEGKLSDDLTKFLQETTSQTSAANEKLIVADQKLGATISKKLGIQVISDKIIVDLYRGIRQQIDSLITGIDSADIASMSLGLSHSLSRHKLKFSPDKVDTMIIQAIGLLDDLDKELNTYAMRVKEWYGWHFPEMSKIVVDNLAYAKVVKTMGFRSNAHETDLSEILPEDLEKGVKEAAEVSMGTEISDEDINNIIMGCDQVISLTAYRAELYEYLKNRMTAIAPNLTTLVGELVGARLISHAGSLVNLAKHPASTIQILGAEKALFRALKTKSPTPKYGLIYHASLVGQASPKNKGKVARLLATKSSISVRYDALAEEKDITAELGHNCRKMLEKRIGVLERGGVQERKQDRKQAKVEIVSTAPLYNTAADAVKVKSKKSGEDDDKKEQPNLMQPKKEKKVSGEQKMKTEAGPSRSKDDKLEVKAEIQKKSEEESSKTDKEKKLAEESGEAVASSSKVKALKKRKVEEEEGEKSEVTSKKVPSESEPSKVKSKKHKAKELVGEDTKKSEVVASSSKTESEPSGAKSSKKRKTEETGDDDKKERISEPKKKKSKKSKAEEPPTHEKVEDTKTEKKESEGTIVESSKSKEKKEGKKKKTPK